MPTYPELLERLLRDLGQVAQPRRQDLPPGFASFSSVGKRGKKEEEEEQGGQDSCRVYSRSSGGEESPFLGMRA